MSVWQETPDRDEVFHSYKTIDVIILVLVGFVDVSLNNLLIRLRIRLRALLNITQVVKIRLGNSFEDFNRPANVYLFGMSTDPLHKWRLNLNNNTRYILSLTFM